MLVDSNRFEFDTTDPDVTTADLDLSDATDLDCTFWTSVSGYDGLPYIHVIEDGHSGVI